MANIYLQVPYYVDCFYRNRSTEESQWIPVGTPLEFSKYSEEYYIMRRNLCCDIELNPQAKCFSHHTWRTMLTGKSPMTGEKLLLRDKNEWLSIQETATLLGVKCGAHADVYSYLCIKIPNEVFTGGQVHRTNSSYSLSDTGTKQLRDCMMIEFQHAVTIYIKAMEHYIVRQGGTPTRIELINTFLSRYGIFNVAGHKERESLRRMLNRWLGDERYIMEAERLATEFYLPLVEK